MSPPWMPLYISDYRGDTPHLSAAQHGAYLLLIMHYWQHGRLPHDDEQLARIAAMSHAEWRRAKPVVSAFFKDWRHARIDAELLKADVKHNRRVQAGKAGGLASANAKQNPSNASSNSQASSSQPESKEDPSQGERLAEEDRGTPSPLRRVK